ncbi:29760_t:CDS:2, partial [Gigaspora margarita]
PSVIQSLDGTLTQQPKGTIGIVVVPDNSDFTFRCKEKSKISVYPIILTKQKKFPTPEEKNFFGIRILKWEKVEVGKGALH